MDFTKSLIENDSIALNVEANDWKEVIQKSVQPLIDSKAVTQQYVEEIIKSTEKFGSYYILLDRFAMPHARPDNSYIKKDSFSFIILKKPVFFPDDQPVEFLACLAATSKETHLGESLPQIATIFSEKSIFDELKEAQTKEEVLKIFNKRKDNND